MDTGQHKGCEIVKFKCLSCKKSRNNKKDENQGSNPQFSMLTTPPHSSMSSGFCFRTHATGFTNWNNMGRGTNEGLLWDWSITYVLFDSMDRFTPTYKIKFMITWKTTSSNFASTKVFFSDISWRQRWALHWPLLPQGKLIHSSRLDKWTKIHGKPTPLWLEPTGKIVESFVRIC